MLKKCFKMRIKYFAFSLRLFQIHITQTVDNTQSNYYVYIQKSAAK